MHVGIVEQVGTPLELYEAGQCLRRVVSRITGDEFRLSGRLSSESAASFVGEGGLTIPISSPPPLGEPQRRVRVSPGGDRSRSEFADQDAPSLTEPTDAETHVFGGWAASTPSPSCAARVIRPGNRDRDIGSA